MPRPNILWYCTDQQRFDTIAGLGYDHAHTPRLDAFMGEAVTFTHAYAQSPICTPSRASFLTGMYPSAVPVNQNGNPRFPASAAERLLSRRLRDAGYDCGLVGKLHLASAAGGVEERVDDGYRFFRYSHDQRGPGLFGHDYAEWLRLQDEDADALLGEPMSRSAYRDLGNRDVQGGVRVPTADLDNVPAHVHQSHWCTEMALEFIDKNRREDQPWMLSVNPFDPHPPFDPPLEYYARFDAASLPLPHFEAGDLARQRRLHEAGVDFQSAPAEQDPVFARQRSACYLAMIEQLDHEFGRLLDHLEAIGQRQNTLVIFCSDHGETLGDHGLVLKGCRFYEGAMRVPLMIAGPGVRQPGRVSDALVELTDLAPTIYDAVGEATPWWVQGASLGPLLRADAAAAPAADAAHRSHVRAEYRGAIDFPDQTNATMYRDRQYKLVTYHGKGIHELYDLDADPWEHQDLAGAPAHQALLQEMLQQNFDATVAASAPVPPRIANY